MNLRPSGYEPDELPGCSTPRRCLWPRWRGGAPERRAQSDEVCVVCLAGLAASYSPASLGAVPSALRAFTAEFGMGSGGAPPAMTTRPAKHTCQP